VRRRATDGEESVMKTCPVCGEKNPLSAKNCELCGESLAGVPADDDTGVAATPSPHNPEPVAALSLTPI